MSRDRKPAALPGLGGDDGPRRVRRVRRSVDAQLKAQRDLGHLETVDEGMVGLARTLADAIDDTWAGDEPNAYTVGALAGRLFPVLQTLRGDVRGGAGDGLDLELEQLRTALRDAARSRPTDDR